MSPSDKIKFLNNLSIDDSKSFDVIRDLVFDKDKEVRENAFAALDDFPNEKTFNLLVSELEKSERDDSRYIWLALRNFYSSQLKEFVLNEINENVKNKHTLHHIAIHLKYFPKEFAVPILLDLLWNFPDERVCGFAVESLCWFNNITLSKEWEKLRLYGHRFVEEMATLANVQLSKGLSEQKPFKIENSEISSLNINNSIKLAEAHNKKEEYVGFL